jgi:hypothetical protein
MLKEQLSLIAHSLHMCLIFIRDHDKYYLSFIGKITEAWRCKFMHKSKLLTGREYALFILET